MAQRGFYFHLHQAQVQTGGEGRESPCAGRPPML